MCLALPAKVTDIAEDRQTGIAEVGGVGKTVSFALLDDVDIGDYVLIHVGYALTLIDPEEAAKTLALFDEIAEVSS